MVKPMVAPCFLKLPSRDIIMFPLRCCRIWYRLNQMRPPFGSFGYIWCKKHWIQSLLPLSSAVHSGPCWLCKDDIWLVVYLPLWKILVSWDDYLFHIYGKRKHVPNHQPDILNHYDSNWHTNDPLIAAIAVPWAHLGVTGPVHLGPKCWPWASYLPQNLHLSPRVRMLALLGMVWWSLCSSNLPFLKFLKAMFFEDNPSQLPHQPVTIAGNLGKGLVAQASYWYA